MQPLYTLPFHSSRNIPLLTKLRILMCLRWSCMGLANVKFPLRLTVCWANLASLTTHSRRRNYSCACVRACMGSPEFIHSYIHPSIHKVPIDFVQILDLIGFPTADHWTGSGSIFVPKSFTQTIGINSIKHTPCHPSHGRYGTFVIRGLIDQIYRDI